MSILPTTKSKPSIEMNKYTFLLYGERKIGKTCLASMFNDPVFLMCEPGGSALSLYQLKVRKWKRFVDAVNELRTDTRFSTCVIDTGGRAYQYCYDHILETLEVSDPNEEGWGAGWSAVQREFEFQHDKIFSSGKGVLITAHSEMQTIKKKSGLEYTKMKVDLGKQARRYYAGIVDVIIYIHYDEDGNRIMTIAGDEQIEAGSRIKGRFNYPDGSPIANIPMGKDEAEAYRNLTLAFNNKLPKPITVKGKFK